MKITSASTPQPQRIARLEQKLEEAYGTYMYCEAADFQSAQERATSAEMSKQMSQLRRELAELRGDSVLSPAPLTSYLEQLEKQHPLAGVSPAITQKLIPHLHARSEGLSDDVADIQDALIHKKIEPEQLHTALQQQAQNRPSIHKKDAPEVRQQTAQILKEGVPKEGPDLFATSEALIQAVLDNPKASELQKAVAELAQEQSLPVQAADLSNRSWQAVYQKGDLGRWSTRLQEEKKPGLADRMATMLDHPDLKFPKEERRQAVEALTGWLQQRAEKALQNPYSTASFMKELTRWSKYGVDTDSLLKS
ncbi:hypothetical protein ABS71_17885 [bacterium SCN 62-11]|nr:hypothetical protein [Candidatus Eremiobacteraeota bacterium]ODT59453.1 MAG: hypothetical protein ABS71_17885 [bacterium SCN 62-11]